MTQKGRIKRELSCFVGSETFWKTPYGIILTEGVHYVCEECKAYWFVDLIASHVLANPKCRGEEFLTFRLRAANNTGIVTITDGNNNTLDTQAIEYTDFPLPKITVWYVNKTILLPSEY